MRKTFGFLTGFAAALGTGVALNAVQRPQHRPRVPEHAREDAAGNALDIARIELLERTVAEQSEIIASFRVRMLQTDEHLIELLSAVDRLCERVASATPKKPSGAFGDHLKEEIARR